jgi:hypothetical protein
VLATLDEITDIVKNVEIAIIIIDIKDKILSQNKFKIYLLKVACETNGMKKVTKLIMLSIKHG